MNKLERPRALKSVPAGLEEWPSASKNVPSGLKAFKEIALSEALFKRSAFQAKRSLSEVLLKRNGHYLL